MDVLATDDDISADNEKSAFLYAKAVPMPTENYADFFLLFDLLCSAHIKGRETAWGAHLRVFGR